LPPMGPPELKRVGARIFVGAFPCGGAGGWGGGGGGRGGGAGGGGDALDAGFNAAQLQRLQQSEGRVDEREKEVMGVMQSINDLMEVMHDLSVLVIDQGTMLDRIDYHVEQVAGHVESGVLEIERAERTQKQSRNWLVIGVLLALVLVMAVIVMVRYA